VADISCSLVVIEHPRRPRELVGLQMLGLATATLMSVYRSPKTGKAVTRAGIAYAGLWTAVISARAAFSYGSVHWFGPQLGRWMANHSVTSSAITDGLIFMAVAMLLTRVIAMGLRAKNLATPDLSTTSYAPSR
jgi:hypothetical protein